MLSSIAAVFRFECRRTLTVPRIIGWACLALFPPVLVGVVHYLQLSVVDRRFWIPPQALWIMFAALIPGVTCLLGLLLWATPIISAELEGRTWIYLATRPNGKGAVLFGKYLTAVCWTTSAALVALTLSVIVMPGPHIDPNASMEVQESLAQGAPIEIEEPSNQPFRLWRVLSILVLLSCAAFGAIYVTLGVLFQKRAMVFAVIYTLLIEGVVATIPAIINKVTIHYRLRALFAKWMAREDLLTEETVPWLGAEPVWQHLLALAAIVIALLSVSYYSLHTRELAGNDES